MRFLWLPLCVLLGCVTAPPVAPAWTLPTDTADVCASHCRSLGMDMGAVVIVRNSTGCVCQPRGAAPRASSGGTGGTVGALLAVWDEEGRQQQLRQQQWWQQQLRIHQREEERYWQQQPRTPTGAVNGLDGWRQQ